MHQYKTFGQMLLWLLRDRHCTMKELTQRMELKSGNSVARIVADKTSVKKIREFYAALLQKNPLQLVEREKKALQDAIEVNEVGLDEYAAQRQTRYLIKVRVPQPACVCTKEFGKTGHIISTFDDLMVSYENYASVEIVLKNAALGGVTRGLKTLLERCAPKTAVCVEHYVNESESKAKQIVGFLNLLDVMGHPNYNFCFFKNGVQDGMEFYDVYSNVMVALKTDKKGNKWTDIALFHTPTSFALLHNVPGEDPYGFHRMQFDTLRMQHNLAKIGETHTSRVEGIVEYHKKLLALDLTGGELFSLRPDISLCMMPVDIAVVVARTLMTSSDRHSEALVEEYVQVQRQRYDLFAKSGRKQTFVFSPQGMHCFLRYGKSKANVFGLRSLTTHESHSIVESMLQVARENPNITYHLLKKELEYNGISYLLYGDKTLMIDKYQGFRDYDLKQNIHACWIQAPSILQSFKTFMTNDLPKQYAYTHEETLALLEEMLHETA